MIKTFLDLYRLKDKLVGKMPEAQWRMMLDLACNGPCDTTKLSYGSGVPPTTALRHMSMLCKGGWATISGDPEDKRRKIYTPTEKLTSLFAA
ncbi:MarR family winged helix-turn-helix transcriptional regulator [Erythrobacter aureus]|uniref:MarR family transcriptional regulator n=1 Tax=Erythrobacter aureus TaxID=2182384 RepID=A0A345YJ61_9SPHN|nr:MarR family winged helix-turn-helix transcriptional regulator [Erythrobacter aureus]AXK43963.1 MarR family transcriptional regulator [Erythrobacter aureus]